MKTRPPRLKADAAVVCDTEMFAPELPTICVGLRGMVYYELAVEGANHDLHSGVYGGAAPNPFQAIAEIICALKDVKGKKDNFAFLYPSKKPLITCKIWVFRVRQGREPFKGESRWLRQNSKPAPKWWWISSLTRVWKFFGD